MKPRFVKKPSDCHILIVDDDEENCIMLNEVFGKSYHVVTCTSGTDAISLIDRHNFDVVITDLKIPYVSGIEILESAKRKDEYTEVIIMTGYGSLTTATTAINQGVNSYLIKPVQITEFTIQVEKAVASRLFHLRSIELMRQTDEFSPDVKLHVHEITSLYYFIRKLMLSLEVPEIMRISLDEALCRLGGQLAVIHIAISGVEELFVMPSTATNDKSAITTFIERHWQQVKSPGTGKTEYVMPSPQFFKGRQGGAGDLETTVPLSVPMMVADRMLGLLTIFVVSPQGTQPDHGQYLYVFSSLVSTVIEHGYSALQARRQAKTDSLTGISNHRHFHETLDREIARANRKKSGFTLILLDIDDFKRVNDTYGHQVGDAVLIDLTSRISSMIRTGDVFARYGGEEFGLVLPDTEPQGAEVLASRILAAIALNSFTFAHHEIFYTVSMGLAVYNGTLPVDKDSLVAAADKALYVSKENGKNRLSVGLITL